MPATINYEFGDVVLVTFPFTDQTTGKKRPAVVVSSAAYHLEHPDLILMAVTSQMKSASNFGEMTVTQWRTTGFRNPP
jgi:mRNA interferase MazF